MYVLICCEESQRVCLEFRKLGVFAFSCDILPCSGGHPEYHIQSDVIPLLNGFCSFQTQDGKFHIIQKKWDLLICHPPCTRLCSSGQRWLYFGSYDYRQAKKLEQKNAIDFFMKFVDADCDHICIENPIGIMSTLYRKPDQIYNPYDFLGETECKATCLWLKNLPLLVPTRTVPLDASLRTHDVHLGFSKSWGSLECSRLRSRTPIGVAQAIATQYYTFLKG